MRFKLLIYLLDYETSGAASGRDWGCLLVGVFVFRKAVSSNELVERRCWWGLPRAQSPKGERALVRVRGDASGSFDVRERLAEGNDRSRVALGLRSTAGRLRVWIVSCSSPPAT